MTTYTWRYTRALTVCDGYFCVKDTWLVIDVKERQSRNLDNLLSPDDHLIMRCVECQTFFLPREIHMWVIRFRDKDTGQARALPVEVCPVCYDGVGSAQTADIRVEDMKRSYFLTLDRHQYEMTKSAERWGMLYDLKTNQVVSKNPLIETAH